MADVLDGEDFEGFEKFCDTLANLFKNNWRAATIPTGVQPGMLFSRSTDDRLTHRSSGGQNYLVFQGEIVCANNEVVCANNSVVVSLPV